jgi:hypothetical protein
MQIDIRNFDIGNIGNFDIRKTAADAGYVTVGIGVLAFQQAQVRRRELQQRLGESGACLNTLNARAAIDWAQGLGAQVKDRIEPVVGQVVDQAMRVQTIVTRAA